MIVDPSSVIPDCELREQIQDPRATTLDPGYPREACPELVEESRGSVSGMTDHGSTPVVNPR
jgi:hypothetical protein